MLLSVVMRVGNVGLDFFDLVSVFPFDPAFLSDELFDEFVEIIVVSLE